MHLDLLYAYGQLVAAFQVRLKGEGGDHYYAVGVHADIADLQELAGFEDYRGGLVDYGQALLGSGHLRHGVLDHLERHADVQVHAYEFVGFQLRGGGPEISLAGAQVRDVQGLEVEARGYRLAAAGKYRGQGYYFKGYFFHKFSP